MKNITDEIKRIIEKCENGEKLSNFERLNLFSLYYITKIKKQI